MTAYELTEELKLVKKGLDTALALIGALTQRLDALTDKSGGDA